MEKTQDTARKERAEQIRQEREAQADYEKYDNPRD